MSTRPDPPLAVSLAALALRADAATMPEAVRTKAGTCLLDFLAAGLAGAALDWSRQAVAAAIADGGAGRCSILAGGERVGAGAAAFANAVLGGSTWQMDTYADSALHPGVMVIPAALAAAQARGADGAALLEGLVAGYEVAGALGEAMYAGATSFTLRPSGVVGPIAAAAAAARIAGLDLDRTTSALALAANAAAGLLEGPRAGTSELQFHASFAARNGLAACELARAGAHGAATNLDGPFGLIPTLAPAARGRRPADRDGATRILAVLHKPAPACVYVQSPCQAAARIASEAGFDAARVRRVRIGAHPTAIGFPGCDNPRPIESAQAARLSIQYSVASVLAHRAIDVSIWMSPGAMPGVDALAARCELVPRPDLPVQGCSIEVEFEDGTRSSAAASAIAEPGRADIAERFERAARGRIDALDVQQVLRWADDLRTLPDVDALARAAVPAARA
jgi:2-methylcitrate dehydratase PrpD